MIRYATVFVILLASAALAQTPKTLTAKDALQPLNTLIGSWKGTGTPEGTRDEKANGAWSETITWNWKFKESEAWLTATFEKGKHYTHGELRYLTDRNLYQFTLTSTDQSTQTFVGTLKDKALTLTRTGGPADLETRFIINLLHHNRILYRVETRPVGAVTSFTKLFQVGATKEGVPFAAVPKGPECIVSGGLATMKVTYKGQDYWVCCSGCRDAFKDDPEKFIKEAAVKANQKK